MPKCDFNKVVKQLYCNFGCSPVNLLHIFRTPFYKNTYGGLLLTKPDNEISLAKMYCKVNSLKYQISGEIYISQTLKKLNLYVESHIRA